MKKSIFALFLGSVLIFMGGCNSMDAPKSLNGKNGLFAEIQTDKGNIYLELFYQKTPLTVINFVGLAEGTLDSHKGKKFYDGLKFHRVIADFMIQGGDPNGTGSGGPGYQFADECMDELRFDGPGVLAMANAGPGTNGSQFFITHVATPWLNGKHTIFGHVVDAASQKVVDTIKQNDVMKSIKIYRLGEDAQKFTATQADWDNANKVAEAKEEEERAKALQALKDRYADGFAEVRKTFPGYEEDSYGIIYKTTTEGTGSECGSRKKVFVEYKGYFLDKKVFDGSQKFIPGNHPGLDFVTGAGQMIPGFDIMVQQMKKGEVRTIIIPPYLAYGEQGAPGAIPPNSFICFDIELVNVK